MHVHINSEEAKRIAGVTLNDEPLQLCFECDTLFGWANCYEKDEAGCIRTDEYGLPVVVRHEGSIRIVPAE